MNDDSTIIYRYTYTAKNGKRYTTRVTLHKRSEDSGVVLLFLKPIGRWPDREDLAELADAAEEKGVPLVKGVLLPAEDEEEWRTANLRPEADQWAA